jgi:hypothetical protein
MLFVCETRAIESPCVRLARERHPTRSFQIPRNKKLPSIRLKHIGSRRLAAAL